MLCKSYSTHRFRMSSRGGVASTNTAGKGKKGVQPRENVERTNAEKSIELLTEREFKERFRILYGVAICLMGGGPVSIENESFNTNVFSNKQFNVELRFPLPFLFKQFLHFTKIPAAFLHPNARRVLMGCSILNMLYHLDLSLLEVLFIYTIKMSGKEIFSLSAHIPSLQFVTGLPNSTKGVAKGHVIVSGPWAGSYEHLTQEFEPRRSLGISSRANYCSLVLSFIIMELFFMHIIWYITRKKMRGRLVEWVEKASFDRLNKLFVIFANEQHHQTLLTDQNLLVVV